MGTEYLCLNFLVKLRALAADREHTNEYSYAVGVPGLLCPTSPHQTGRAALAASMWLHGPACLEVDSSWPAQSIPIDLFSLSLNNICQVSGFPDATGKNGYG